MKKSLPSRWDIALGMAAEFDIDPCREPPKCFACLFARGRSKEPGKAAWNASGLQRCHIIPEACGGSSDVSNLTLMCADCHRECPEVADKAVVVDWMMARPRAIERRFRFEVEQCVDSETLKRVAESGRFDVKKFRRWLDAQSSKVGRHFGVGFAGRLPTYATLVAQYLATLDVASPEHESIESLVRRLADSRKQVGQEGRGEKARTEVATPRQMPLF